MRNRELSSAFALLASAVTVPVVLSAGPAAADSCDHSTHHYASKTNLVVWSRTNSEYSKWNNTDVMQSFSVQFGKTLTASETKSWTAGGSAGFNWGVVSADVSGSYGQAATQGVSVAKTLTENVNVPAHHTGWFRVDVYQQRYSWHAVTERWNAAQARCVTQPVAGALWGDKKVQLVDITVKGHKHPAKR